MPALVTFIWLCFAHCIADYSFQSTFMAQAKNRHTDVGRDHWKTVLSAHSMIHGGGTGLVLHLVAGVPFAVATIFVMAEFLVHFAIDFGKCEDWFSFHTDQALHIACKAFWVLVIFAFLPGVTH